MKILPYNRQKAVNYAIKYAYVRDPAFFDFTEFGGNCTAYVSQCLYHASQVMDPTPIFGWYYFSSYNRSPSWSGVEFLYNYLTTGQRLGPFASLCKVNQLEVGDIVQLKFKEFNQFTHTLIVTKINSALPITEKNIFISANTYDVLNKNLASYNYEKIRFLKIEGVRTN